MSEDIKAEYSGGKKCIAIAGNYLVSRCGGRGRKNKSQLSVPWRQQFNQHGYSWIICLNIQRGCFSFKQGKTFFLKSSQRSSCRHDWYCTIIWHTCMNDTLYKTYLAPKVPCSQAPKPHRWNRGVVVELRTLCVCHEDWIMIVYWRLESNMYQKK